MTERVAIVGGGITGLAAAHELRCRGAEFVLLEGSPRVGGKVAGGAVEGSALPFDVDMAADGFLAREPEMAQLCVELGFGDDLVSPVGSGAHLWVDGALRRIPPGVLGAPLDPGAVAASGIVSAAGVDALAVGLAADLPPLQGDATVGAVLRPRVGDEVFERLVDPLLGGINAGNADEMSIRAGAAALAGAAAKGGPFGAALQEHVAASAGGPVFHGVRGGTQRVVDALADSLGDRIRTATPVRGLERSGTGWILHTDGDRVEAGHVIFTTPGWITGGLLAGHAPAAAAVFADLVYADAALVTFVADRAAIADRLDGTGFLVPRDQGLLMTACSWSSSKWAHYDDGTHAILRVSTGRTDDRRWLELSPQSLVDRLVDELRTTVGLAAEPIARLTPWRRCLPQYRPGHLERCNRVDTWLAHDTPGLVVAGASMRGLGLPACVRQGRIAASSVTA